MGNHDWYMAGGGFCPRSRSVNDCLAYQRTIIEPEHLNWLRSFPVQREIGEIRLVHGGWADPIDEYLKPSGEYFERVLGGCSYLVTPICKLCSNLVIRFIATQAQWGSERRRSARGVCCVRAGEFSLHRVEYDMQKVFELMDAAGFNDYYYGGLKTGARNLRGWRTIRTSFYV